MKSGDDLDLFYIKPGEMQIEIRTNTLVGHSNDFCVRILDKNTSPI
jgi:hypothetical protein